MIPKLNTPYNFNKVEETFILPSLTIPGHDLDANKALEYLMNNEPIPARYLSRAIHDSDMDGVLDTEARMYDILDLKLNKTQREFSLLAKYADTDVAHSAKRIRQEREEKNTESRNDETLSTERSKGDNFEE
jgi:hypothetical protein